MARIGTSCALTLVPYWPPLRSAPILGSAMIARPASCAGRPGMRAPFSSVMGVTGPGTWAAAPRPSRRSRRASGCALCVPGAIRVRWTLLGPNAPENLVPPPPPAKRSPPLVRERRVGIPSVLDIGVSPTKLTGWSRSSPRILGAVSPSMCAPIAVSVMSSTTVVTSVPAVSKCTRGLGALHPLKSRICFGAVGVIDGFISTVNPSGTLPPPPPPATIIGVPCALNALWSATLRPFHVSDASLPEGPETGVDRVSGSSVSTLLGWAVKRLREEATPRSKGPGVCEEDCMLISMCVCVYPSEVGLFFTFSKREKRRGERGKGKKRRGKADGMYLSM